MFKKLYKISSPRKGLKKEIWQKLSLDSGIRLPKFSQALIFRPAFLVLVLFLIGSFGTSVYAYESPDVREGHPLHGLKRAIERVESKLAFNPEIQAMVQLKLSEKRLKELEYKVKSKEQISGKDSQKLIQVRKDLEATSSTIPKVKNKAKARALRNHLDDIRVNKIERVRKLLEAKEEKMDLKSEHKGEINLNNNKVDIDIINNFDARVQGNKTSLNGEIKTKMYAKD